MEEERWLPVVGWEGFYEVSDLGRIRSVPHQTRTGMRGGQIKTPTVAKGEGRNVIRLSAGKSRQETVQVAPLVAVAFLGPCPPGQEVRHGPAGRLDDRVANLCYGTHAENMRDKIRDGTSKINQNTCKDRCPKCGGPWSARTVRRRGQETQERYCPPCRGAQIKAWQEANPEKVREAGRRHDQKRGWRRASGLTPETDEPLF